jgi:NAD(P)-dependent dehydrogenase (short-subunit alcohol dehydrogenase family)
MKISYANKVVLVTGGTSGIGRAAAKAFAEAGGKVVITGRRQKEGVDVVREITKAGGTAAFIKADVSNEVDVEKTIQFVLSTQGRLDVALNNAGVELLSPLDQLTKEQYLSIFDINVWGVLNSMKHEIRAMLSNGGGAIVNTSSVAGQLGYPQGSLYTATKHAVEGLTKAIALEFATRGIRVNAVAPAGIETEMLDRAFPNESDGRKYLLSLHPIGRFGTSEEIAAAVLYLASDVAKFTTGTTLIVDGGVTVS